MFRPSSPNRRGRVAFVLHAHLPWLREPTEAIGSEERWLFEALWECYLPLVGVLESLEAPSSGAPLMTLSLSPTLMAMLRDPQLTPRFSRYADGLEATFSERAKREPSWAAAAADHSARLARSRATFARVHGDVIGAFVALAEGGLIELATTAATHAFLPSLRTADAVRGQLRMGLRYFQAITKRLPRTVWLPECAYDERLEGILADSGIQATVLAEHGLLLATPRPPHGTDTPIVGEGPIAFFGQCQRLVDLVWSRERGYPADADYREFYAPVTDDGSLKPYRVTGGSGPKLPYDPARAALRVAEHANHFLSAAARAVDASLAPEPVFVVAFDAELFGHWWWEGPAFLEAVLRALADRDLASSLGAYLDTDPLLPVARPATSTWGRGGYAEVWTHPSSSHAARLLHRAEQRVLAVDAIVRDTPRTETQRRARLWAIRELFLLQASDYAFMLRTGECATFAQDKLFEHATAIEALCEVATRAAEAPSDRATIERWIRRRPVFSELDEDAWSDTFDPW
ncbi:MAG: DUF1957 domain-containing protein [Polyangiaceae bacterium]|nr:DUF1957 domain-containing protein [Polyangiaceae bacterium]